VKVEDLEGVTFGSVVTDIDLEKLDEKTWLDLFELWIARALLIFPDACLSADTQDDFARRFGELEFPRTAISNMGKNGKLYKETTDDVVKVVRGNEGWHHDSTYMPIQAKAAVFSAEIIPKSGGATGWADMRAAYDALDDDMRARISGMQAYHSYYYSQGRDGYLPSEQNDDGTYNYYGFHNHEVSLRKLVKTHPETGRDNLIIGRHAHNIIGMDPQESEEFLDGLNEFACQGDRIYHHHWQRGDAVIWDNRRLMHQATPYDMTEPRRMWHTRIAGDPRTETALNHQ
jgi:alpha-ketoglutarate-dependent taurine dioxygenase